MLWLNQAFAALECSTLYISQKMKYTSTILLTLPAFIGVRFAQAAPPDEKWKNMNVLFIQADQHRYDCIGYSGHSQAKTPHLDQLARQGITFQSSYSCIPTSCPARQSLLSGYWPERHKGLWNYDITLPVTSFTGPTWTQELAKQDLKMGYVGKWHVHPSKDPRHFGFDDYISEQDYNRWRKKQGISDYVSQDSMWAMGGYDPAPKESTRTHWLARKAVELIGRYQADGKQWHVRLETSDPHLPCYPVREFLQMYSPQDIPEWGNYHDTFENKPYIQQQQIYNWRLEDTDWSLWQGYLQRYFANITQLDDAIGMVLSELEEMGVLDNTIIVYTSDHGDAAGSHNMVDKHYVMYEEVTHVPLIIKLPGVQPKNIRAFVNNQLDMAATFCQLYHLNYQTQGESLFPLILTENATDTWRKYAFSNYNGQQFGLYVQRMIRGERFKYVWNMTDVDELYDLQDDPWELKNLIKEEAYSEELRILRKELYDDLKKRKDPLVWQDATKRQLLENMKL